MAEIAGAGGGPPGDRAALALVAGFLFVTAAPLLVAPLVAPPPFRAVGVGVGLLIVLCYTGHVACSSLLLPCSEVRAQLLTGSVRRIAIPVALVPVACAVAALSPVAGVAGVVAAFLAWQFWHFQKQNLGLVSLSAAVLGGAGLRRVERVVFLCAGALGAAGLLARPRLLDLHLAGPPAPFFTALLAAYGSTAAAGVVLALRRLHRRSWPLPVAGLYGLGLVFFLPAFAVTGSLAAVVGMAVAHGLQYLWLLGHLEGVVPARPGRPPRRARVPWPLLAVAAGGGAALTLMGALRSAANPAARAIGGLYLGLVAAHFCLDASIWRLRDEWPRRFVTRRLDLSGAGAPTTAAVLQRSGVVDRRALASSAVGNGLVG